VLGWLILGSFFCFKRWKRFSAIPTAGSN
jgi:hypothetical protein